MVWRDNIWNEINRMKKQLDKLTGGFNFGSGFEEDSPMLEGFSGGYRKAFSDFKETDKEYIIEVEIPGVNKEDIKLNTTEGGIEVKAEKKQEEESGGDEEDEESGGEYSYSKSYAGFYQAFDAPENADLDNIDASYDNGVLTIKLPKKQQDKDKKTIQVK